MYGNPIVKFNLAIPHLTPANISGCIYVCLPELNAQENLRSGHKCAPVLSLMLESANIRFLNHLHNNHVAMFTKIIISVSQLRGHGQILQMGMVVTSQGLALNCRHIAQNDSCVPSVATTHTRLKNRPCKSTIHHCFVLM